MCSRFLLARLYVDSLLDKRTKSSVQSALAKLSQGSQTLEKAYEDAVQRLKSQLPEDAALATRIITWIVHAKKALTTKELRHALAVRHGESYLDFDNILETEDIVSVCAGLVTIDDQSKVIRLVHYTTHQYFEGAREKESHRDQLDITRTCLTYLSYDEFQRGQCPSGFDFESRLKKYPLLGYAADYWGAHAMGVQNCVTELACSICLNDGLVSSMVQAESAYVSGGRIYCETRSISGLGLNVLASFGLRDIAEKFLVGLGGDIARWIAQKDHGGRNCLYVAAEFGHESTVRLLLDQGADVNTPGGEFGTVLCVATSAGNLSIVRLLLAHGAEVDAQSNTLNSPLQLAFRAGNKEMFQLLVDHGANVSLANIGNRMPLVLASEEGWHDLLELLLDVDVDAAGGLDQIDDLGWTPLHVACFNGHIQVTELLLRRGANANSVSKHGWSPIQIAAEVGQAETVKMLKNHGAETNVAGNSGETPLHLAAVHGHASVVQLLLELEVVIDARDDHGRTALDAGSFGGHLEVVQRLLQHGATINSRDNEDWTPINKASSQGHTDVVKALLKQGADIHLPNSAGWTPIYSASETGSLGIAELLLHHGADVNTPDSTGWTALTIAAYGGYEHIVELLLPYSNLSAITINTPHGSFLTLLARGGHTNLLRLVYAQHLLIRFPPLNQTDGRRCTGRVVQEISMSLSAWLKKDY
jgi:ankyrin repeat protein